MLDSKQYRLIPKFENHDLKHLVLDYEMTMKDEIRMQAFMFGNGNYTIPCFAILGFGAILLPDLWSTFYQDYKKGRKSIPISLNGTSVTPRKFNYWLHLLHYFHSLF